MTKETDIFECWDKGDFQAINNFIIKSCLTNKANVKRNENVSVLRMHQKEEFVGGRFIFLLFYWEQNRGKKSDLTLQFEIIVHQFGNYDQKQLQEFEAETVGGGYATC